MSGPGSDESAEAAARAVGLRDAHLHLAAHGEELSAVDLSGCGGVEECLRLVGERAAGTARDGWVVARRARVEAWAERRYPTAGELDEAGGGRAVVVASFDHHAGAASSAALRAAGIGGEGTDPGGGVVERDAATGEPTGLLLEGAYGRLCEALPRRSDEEVRGHVRAALEDLGGCGFVEVHDMMTSVREARELAEMDRAGEIGMEVRCYAVAGQFEGVREALGAHEGDEGVGARARVRLGGMKLFVDGTLNSRTAWMLESYEDPIPAHPRGTALMSREAIDGALARARAEGFDVAAHAIGDAAVRVLLDAYEAVGGSGGAGFGLRIEHAQFVDAADVGRFGRLGVVASLQACHLLADIEAILRLTPRRADRAFPLRELIDGARGAGREAEELVYLGSDTPVVAPTPRDNVQAAVHRRRAEAGCPVVGASQAISEGEAWGLMRAGIGGMG